MGCSQNSGPLVVIGLYNGTYYSGVPKLDPNFGNYPFIDLGLQGLEISLGLRV